jgi:hypothetical protein
MPGNVTTKRRQGFLWRRLGFGLAFVLTFVLTVPLGGVVGLTALHLLAWGGLIGVFLDAPRPVSEKATFKCFDGQYHQVLGEAVGRCVLTERLAPPQAPACRNLRLKVSTV